MYETLFRLYWSKKLTRTGLDNAVTKNWISPAQRDAIVAGTSPDPTIVPDPPPPTPEPDPTPSA